MSFVAILRKDLTNVDTGPSFTNATDGQAWCDEANQKLIAVAGIKQKRYGKFVEYETSWWLYQHPEPVPTAPKEVHFKFCGCCKVRDYSSIKPPSPPPSFPTDLDF